MKKNIKAFTLIELLVVTTIIALISGSGMFYFYDFVKQQEINQKLVIIEDDLKELDKKVKKYEIFDYELQFNISNTGSLLYITYINNFDSSNQTITITDINSGSGKINAIGAGSGTIKIYKNHKLFLNNEIEKSNDYEFNFKETESYKITGTHSGEILNDIELKYFSEENLYPEKNDLLKLTEINSQENKGGTDYPSIIITNIGGKKKIGNDENEVFLFFDNNGKESFIKITK